MDQVDVKLTKEPPSTECKGIRVSLISEEGQMEILFLPQMIEGKYLFHQAVSHKALTFLSIEAGRSDKDGSALWMLCCGPNTCLLGGKSIDARRVPLVHKHLYYLTCNGQRYMIYAEMQTASGSVFHNYRAPKNVPITIGRGDTNDIISTGRFISRNHAAMCLTDSGWEIRDQGSANGVYVNCRRVDMAKLNLGDSIYLTGMQILVGTDFLSICSGDNELFVNQAVLHPLKAVRGAAPPAHRPRKLFNRQPRSRFSMAWETIAIDAPPMPMNSNRMPLVLRMGSSAVMGGRAIAMGSYSMALTSLVFPFLTQRYNEKERKEYEARRLEKYTEYLAQKKQQIIDECNHEYQILNENYPDLSTVLQHCGGKRLWERRKSDDDFLTLRIGSGTIQMQAELEYPSRRFEMEQDTLEEQMFALAEKQYLIERAPIMLSLMQDYAIGVLGERPAVLQFVSALLTQLVMTHSYDEVKCVFLVEEEELRRMDDIRYLPHLWNDERNIRFLVTDQAGTGTIGEYLRQEMQELMQDKKDYEKYKKTHPHYVVFALSKRLYDSIEVLKEVLMEEKECVALSVVAAFDALPKECTKVIQMRESAADDQACFDVLHPDMPPQKFALDQCDGAILHRAMKALANTQLKSLSGNFTLPKTFTFLEMFGVGKVEHLNLLKRWSESDPIHSLATPVGIGTDGELFMLDLHQSRQGPHGLVAGMTGSGKSEFIITYILSMAVNYSPDEVAFVLIDYKGGGLAGAFEDESRGIHLPHLVGTITNLDGASIARSMVSIESELARRQRIFNEAKSACNEGTMDIYTYQRLYRSHQVQEPLPHLFIISDEFAELKSQQPEFMDKLISTARIGRSLGVHLILATQKPAGVVNDQIWSNTKFRVCLRVQDKSDSQDMLKRPEAAELKETGRFYLQVGYNEYFALGQSAWCGADYIPQDEVVAQKDESVQVIDSAAQVLLTAKPSKHETKSGVKQVVAIVQYLSVLARREHLIPRTLLPPMLPRVLTLSQLRQKYPASTVKGISATIGMIDDPAFQQQYPFEMDLQSMHNALIVGESGCGKTNLIQTMLLDLIEHYTPEQVVFYILDFSSKLLTRFRQVPHCGAVLTDEDEDKLPLVFEIIASETKRRQKLFAEAEVNGFADYCRIKPLPLVLFIIDGVAAFGGTKKGSVYLGRLNETMREGAAYGVQYILAGSHHNQFPVRIRQEAGFRLGMSLKDRYDYTEVLEKKTTYQPPAIPGRGLCLWDDRPLEFQTAIFSVEEDPQQAALVLREELERIARRDAGFQPAAGLADLPREQSYQEFRSQFGPGRIPLGYTLDRAKPVAIPLKQMFTTSVYFGNKLGIAPVTDNLLEAFCAEQMDLIIVKRGVGSLFEEGSPRMEALRQKTNVTLLTTAPEDLDTLLDRLVEAMKQRSVLKNAFMEQHHLDGADLANMQLAYSYIRAGTRPLMVFFEGYYDMARRLNQIQGAKLSALLGARNPNDDDSPETRRRRGLGYNLYYTCCFLPGEYSKLEIQTTMSSCLNPQKFTLLFGGMLSKAGLLSLEMPSQYKEKSQKPLAQYDRFLMYYNGAFKEMLMPCGRLMQAEVDPDDLPII